MIKKISVLLIAGILVTGCANNMEQGMTGTRSNKGTGTATGAAGGAALGALAGQMLGKDSKSTLIGAGIGALVGGGAGYAWGASRDKQEQELRSRLGNSGISIMRQGEFLKMILPGSASFDSGSSNILPSFYAPLNTIADVLRKYPDSKITVNGYTDATGNYNSNMMLSQSRATNVAMYIASQGVNGGRISYNGYGPSNFIADNSTPQGKALNRRVEIFIMPNDQR